MPKKNERGKVVYAENVDPVLYERYKKHLDRQNKKITKELGNLLNKAMEDEIDRYELDPVTGKKLETNGGA